MRNLFTAAALAVLLPATAHAQEADPRVDDVVETSDGYKCRAHEMPELSLSHDWRGADRGAIWEGRAREAGAGDYRIRVAFHPQEDRPSVAAPALLGFEFNMPRTPLRAPAKSAHLRLDGIADATPLQLEGDPTYLSLAVAERQREELAQRLMAVSIVEIDLVDASGAPLGRYSWDIRRLRRSNEVLQVINWSCR
ncbi:hypothetical protein OF829_10500 [Sphingomonas sp. LB-2]|uniref:hypothetical protein n=1 Tax=Sphingomonas caeni TaxID=2984949 RepID=UPI0022300946|nr:hypothetical protein [Sphingomonas caeni]MCW3847672.1 hypothetical protein [Sphingomonas caeni]